MFYQNKIKNLAKAKNFGKVYISILFILTFLLILFNKADYFVINKIKTLGIDKAASTACTFMPDEAKLPPPTCAKIHLTFGNLSAKAVYRAFIVTSGGSKGNNV